jgi:hypothetical protein
VIGNYKIVEFKIIGVGRVVDTALYGELYSRV